MSLAKKSALGRGLASLIPDNAFDASEPASNRLNLRVVPLDEIRSNPEQPREVFDASDLQSLADSIRVHGVLQPLVVRKEEGRYVLVAGERRLRAAALAGLTEVPVVVREVDGRNEQLELALVENLQRTDLDPIEAAKGYQRLIDEFGYTQEEVAAKVGKERPTVANALRLLKLPDFALQALRDGQITAGHARALLALAEPDEIRRTLARIVAQGLSVRQTEKLVASLTKVEPPRERQRERVYEYATKLLSETLHTSVVISGRKDGSGRILIDYASAEDLQRLVDQLQSAPRPAAHR